MSEFRLPSLPPSLIPTSLPEGEKQGARLVQSGLMTLERYVKDFAAALALFDFACGKDAPHEWALVAARDGGMTIYHFYDAFAGIRKTARTCPTFVPLVDWSQFKEVERLYRARFRDYVDMRDSISHAGDKMATPELYAEHSFTGTVNTPMVKSGGNVLTHFTMTNCLEGRRFTNTWEGKIVSYEISQQSLAYLDEAKERVWASFVPVASALRQAAFSVSQNPTPSKPDEPQT